MGMAARWLKSFLTGKREEKKTLTSSLLTKAQLDPIQVRTPKEKKRWSFRKQAAAGKGSTSPDQTVSTPTNALLEAEIDQKTHAMAVAATAAATAGVAVAAAQAAADVMSLTSATTGKTSSAIEEAAVIKVQAAFRSYLVLPVLLSSL
ncbi:uncharacterized protein LOC113460912 [Phoenix dactylifera]|uniref:Uncharacterized protein LOC113460912 n=1 Tax=Phoenix dactylifera TaxID=42345 RepID=A0A8B8JBX0_PHODC|nr:uncharacterized protein LOC113460912 [Phoenix dactylifera]